VTVKNTLYVVHSNLERGFWNNSQGWVDSVFEASVFVSQGTDKPIFNLPMSKNNDATWMPIQYLEE
jgi:hypothetical protein